MKFFMRTLVLALFALTCLQAQDVTKGSIVGVVRDVLERGYEQEDKPAVYLSSPQAGANPANLVVRVADDPLAQAAAVQRVIRNVDPGQPVSLIR